MMSSKLKNNEKNEKNYNFTLMFDLQNVLYKQDSSSIFQINQTKFQEILHMFVKNNISNVIVYSSKILTNINITRSNIKNIEFIVSSLIKKNIKTGIVIYNFNVFDKKYINYIKNCSFDLIYVTFTEFTPENLIKIKTNINGSLNFISSDINYNKILFTEPYINKTNNVILYNTRYQYDYFVFKNFETTYILGINKFI